MIQHFLQWRGKRKEHRRLWTELLALRDVETEGGVLLKKIMLLSYFNLPMECLSEKELTIAGEVNRVMTEAIVDFGVSVKDIKFNA